MKQNIFYPKETLLYLKEAVLHLKESILELKEVFLYVKETFLKDVRTVCMLFEQKWHPKSAFLLTFARFKR